MAELEHAAQGRVLQELHEVEQSLRSAVRLASLNPTDAFLSLLRVSARAARIDLRSLLPWLCERRSALLAEIARAKERLAREIGGEAENLEHWFSLEHQRLELLSDAGVLLHRLAPLPSRDDILRDHDSLIAQAVELEHSGAVHRRRAEEAAARAASASDECAASPDTAPEEYEFPWRWWMVIVLLGVAKVAYAVTALGPEIHLTACAATAGYLGLLALLGCLRQARSRRALELWAQRGEAESEQRRADRLRDEALVSARKAEADARAARETAARLAPVVAFDADPARGARREWLRGVADEQRCRTVDRATRAVFTL